MWLLKWLKWLVAGVVWWQLVTWYLKDKKFKSTLDKAEWIDKVKTIGKYLYDTNKEIVADIQTKADEFDIEETKQTVKKTIDQVKQNIDDIKNNLLSKLHDIEIQVETYYHDAKENIDDLELNDRYREIASKIALYAKSLKKYIEDGVITIDDKLNLETRLANISKKLKTVKK